ncbi:unnamed protein product [Bemisia tabaci]|uniref:Uncharacterized protein n=1 Tax=Bemisia tabaci TaxID=7038 RepID=A0A9P0EYG9_BEMTA|nr:unnamed protein product [Bemisia tabaci]
MEAMSIGVPTLGLPFFSDQRRNVVWYREHGIGLQIDYEDETVSSMVEKINTIIRTPSPRRPLFETIKLGSPGRESNPEPPDRRASATTTTPQEVDKQSTTGRQFANV